MIDVLIGLGIGYLALTLVFGVLGIVLFVYLFRRFIQMGREHDEFSREAQERLNRRGHRRR